MTTAEPTASHKTGLADEIARHLNERAAVPRATIARAVATLGEERARTLLAETQRTEAKGGLMLPDGSRRRTPGGVFFHLVRHSATPEERKTIFPHKGSGLGQHPQPTSSTPTLPPLDWAQFTTLTAELQAGEATSVKITVIGRPAQILERGDVTIVALRSEKAPTLPKGLPTPTRPTDYAILIAKKQWQKVAQAAANPQDLLIVEGFPTVDPRFNGITVLATNTTTKQLQQAERLRRQATQQAATP